MSNVKVTLNDRIDAIENAYFKGKEISEEDFQFLIERARKSVAKAHKSDKPTKAQIEYRNKLAGVKQFVADMGTVTCRDVQENFSFSNQKAARALRDLVEAGELVKTEAKGKTKATWAIAE